MKTKQKKADQIQDISHESSVNFMGRKQKKV